MKSCENVNLSRPIAAATLDASNKILLIAQKLGEIPNDEDNDHLFQDEIKLMQATSLKKLSSESLPFPTNMMSIGSSYGGSADTF